VNLGYSIQIVWPLAIQEALVSSYENIEPEHLFNGLLKFAELRKDDLKAMIKDSTIIDSLLNEQNDICLFFEEGGLSIPASTSAMRNNIRHMMGKGNGKDDRKFVHRSDKSKQICLRSEEIASADGKKEWQAVHLIEALLEEPENVLAEALAKAGFTKPIAVETPLLDRYGTDFSRETLPSEKGPTDSVSKVLLESLQDNTDANLLLIEKGGRPALEIVREVSSLLKKGEKPYRIVHVDFESIQKDRVDSEGIISKLIDEAIAAGALLYIEGLAYEMAKTPELTGIEAMIKAMEENQLRCIIAVEENLYISKLDKKEPWKKLLRPVWIHPPQKLPW